MFNVVIQPQSQDLQFFFFFQVIQFGGCPSFLNIILKKFKISFRSGLIFLLLAEKKIE